MKTIIPYDDYNHQIHIGCGIIGTVAQNFGREALRNGWKIIEVYETENLPNRPDMEKRG